VFLPSVRASVDNCAGWLAGKWPPQCRLADAGLAAGAGEGLQAPIKWRLVRRNVFPVAGKSHGFLRREAKPIRCHGALPAFANNRGFGGAPKKNGLLIRQPADTIPEGKRRI
jgi:hypothetical protein